MNSFGQKAKFEFISIYGAVAMKGKTLQNCLEMNLFMKSTGLPSDSVIIKKINACL